MSILRTVFSTGGLLAAALLTACGGGDNTSTTGSDGSGGGGGGSSDFKPGPHTALPQVVTAKGPVIKKPRVRLITYASNPNLSKLEGFVQELASTSYWADTTSEYGVGALTVGQTIQIAGSAPSTLADSDLTTMLQTNLAAGGAWGSADTNTLYVFVMPQGTIVSSGGACCTDFDGYHDETTVGGTPIAYASVCSCPGFDGPKVNAIQQITVAMSHEMVEMSTDPLPNTNTAFGQTDDDDAVWTITTGGEVADMCEFNDDSYLVPKGSTYMVQRSWSNAAALAGHNPCVPAPSAPYFDSVPELPASVTIQYYGAWNTKGVSIPVGQTKTIPVQLFSDGETSGPWTVTAYDYNHDFMGGEKELELSLDKTTGSNGDTLNLTIKVLKLDAMIQGEAFILDSTLNGQSNLAMGVVAN